MADPMDTAAWLMREHASSAQFVPFANDRRITSMADAYEVQRQYVQLRRQARASACAGYKIGLTSKSMQAMCHIDTPVAGVVLASQVHASGAELRRSEYGRFGIEFEIAVRLQSDVIVQADGSASIESIAAAVDAVCPAIEIVDDRHCDYKTLDVLSLVADNAWNAGIVLGEFKTVWPDLAAVQGSVYVDGSSEALDQGVGSAVLGHPFVPVAWLAEHLAKSGQALKAGDIVMTGSMMTTKFPDTSGRWSFVAGELGSVQVWVN
jgi:2-keto-4-pentenoate hydratase